MSIEQILNHEMQLSNYQLQSLKMLSISKKKLFSIYIEWKIIIPIFSIILMIAKTLCLWINTRVMKMI